MIQVPINPKLSVEKSSYSSYTSTTSDFWLQKLQNDQEGKFQVQFVQENIPPTAIVYNAFVEAWMTAYNKHKDLIISPDDIWLVICLNFSSFVEQNAEKLRSQFVNHQGKAKLQVTDNHFEGQQHWTPFFDQMKEKIKENTKGDIVSTLHADFSTTSLVEDLLSSACIMNSFKKYFDYGRCVPCCGLRNVFFMGTPDDWKLLLQKTEKLSSYGDFGSYTSKVSVIIKKFLDSMNGKADIDWWNRIMNLKSGRLGSGSTTKVSGWFTHFFLGVSEGADIDEISLKSIQFPVEVIDNADISASGKVYVTGGFSGISEVNNAIRPCMGIAVISDLDSRKSS